MERAVGTAPVFRFGLFEADVARNTLLRNGVRVRIQDQPFRVLIFLLEQPGELIARDELRRRLWPEGTFVDFDGSLNVILKKLRAAIDDNSDNPRYIETVPRHGYRFIAPVSVSTAKPEQPVTAPSTALVGPAPLPHAPVTPLSSSKPRQSALLMYASTVLIVLISVAAVWLIRNRRQATGVSPSLGVAAPVSMRKSVAVLGFHNVSGNATDAWLANALAEMLSTELAGGGKLRLVSGEDIANLHLSAPWSETDTLDHETTARIGTALNSDWLVLGSYMTIGKPDHAQLRFDVRLQDAKTGEILTEIAEVGGAQDLFQIVSRAGGKLRDQLGVPRLPELDEATVLASLPRNPEAARFYALGLAKQRQFDASGAKDLLQQAVKIEPTFALGHAMLAQAWFELGYEQKRRDEARKALDFSAGLPRAEHMLVEASYYESLADHEQSASIYHALFELFPDNIEYGLRFATAQTRAGHGSQALATLHRLRNLPPPSSDDPRIDLLESRAIASNKPAALGLVQKAVQKSAAQGKELLYAQARKEECMVLNYGDHPERAGPACEEAYNIFLSAGNRLGAADALRNIADHAGSEGHYAQAIAIYERALNVLQGMGEHEKTGSILNNMAINYENQGKLDRAEGLYRQAKFHFERAGDKGNQATTISNIADILYARGNLEGAAKLYNEALQIEEQLDPSDPSYCLYRLADLELAQGRVAEARLHAEAAIAVLKPQEGAYQYLTGAMLVLGEALEAEGDLKGARRQFEESLSIRQRVGAAELVAEAQVALGSLALDEGNPENAVQLLHSAIPEFEKEKSEPAAGSAYALLSRALLMQRRLEDSRSAVRHAAEISRTNADPALKLALAIQNARLEAAISVQNRGASDRAKAQQSLRSAIATATKLGYYSLQCEARLVLLEMEMKSNSRSRLAALAAEARGHGLELIARRAEHALAPAADVIAGGEPRH